MATPRLTGNRRPRPVLRSLVVLGSTLSSARAVSTYNFGSRVGGAILHYEFSRDECLSSTFTDSASTPLFGRLLRTSQTSCHDGLGVELSAYTTAGSAQVLSENNATAFITAMSGQTSFTLEFWAATEVNSADATDRPIVTIGAVGDSTANTCDSSNTHGTYGLTAYDRESNQKLYFQYAAEISGADYCPVLDSLGGSATSNHSHFVLTVAPNDPNEVAWYVDGALSFSSITTGKNIGSASGAAISTLWAQWGTSYRLQLFGDTQAATIPWNGNLYGLAMYRTALTAAEVLQNYNARLPDSPPSVTTFSATVNEDGMPQDYRKDPSKYNGATSVPALELEWVALTAADQDEEASYPNYNATDQRVRPMAVFLSSLPAKARLYQFVSGAEITATPAEVPPSYEDSSGSVYDAAAAMALSSSVALTKTYRVRVRPDKDQYSDMVSCEPVACLLRRLSFPLARWQHPSRPTRARRTPAAGT